MRPAALSPAALLVALAWAGLLHAQPPRPHRLALVHPGFLEVTPYVEGFREGLRASGLAEGRDVVLDIRFTRGQFEAAASTVAAARTAGPDVIVATTEPLAVAAKAATATIPVVFFDVGDPVAAGLVASFAHPGGNVTGIASMTTELIPKRLEVLKAVVPSLRRVWAFHAMADRSGLAAARHAAEVGPRLGLEVLVRAVESRDDAARELRAVRPGDALLAPPALTASVPGLMVDLGLHARVPGVFATAFWVRGGGLVSYGSDLAWDGAQAARLASRILRGARPRDLPVERSTRIELAVNLKTARGMALTIPPEILQRAEHVIE